jgi:hypothetical protein
MITVTVTDHETGDTETQELDRVAYVLTVNEARGFYVASVQQYANGTEIITIKRDRSGGADDQ